MSEQSWTDLNFTLRGTMQPGNEADAKRIKHLKEYFENLRQPDVIRALIDCHIKVIQNFGSPDNIGGKALPGIERILAKLDKMRMMVPDGSIDQEVEDIKSDINLETDSFFDNE